MRCGALANGGILPAPTNTSRALSFRSEARPSASEDQQASKRERSAINDRSRHMHPVTDQLPAKPPSRTVRAFTRKPNLPTKPRRGNGGLTRKVRAAIDAQAFDGLSRSEAAQRAGLSEHSLYQALRKPSVLAYWNECLQVLRTGERARNIRRLTEIREQDENRTAAVQAIKTLEETADQRSSTGAMRQVTPGVQIIIYAERDGRMVVDESVIEINPVGESVETEPDE